MIVLDPGAGLQTPAGWLVGFEVTQRDSSGIRSSIGRSKETWRVKSWTQSDRCNARKAGPLHPLNPERGSKGTPKPWQYPEAGLECFHPCYDAESALLFEGVRFTAAARERGYRLASRGRA
jgi:hypothetical protein